ncbi:MAG: glycosyl hydrolase [Ignavibacteriaceae bacterium]|nr:glycosyl hydrolase [Ignavibacteriaceae bacterium]
MESGFKTPPDSVKPRVYWYWLSDNISEEGVVRDLEAMDSVGIGGAYIGNIGLDTNETIYGKVKFLSDEWWKITRKAINTASRLGIDIGIFNGPGWSQSGGPWIKTGESMRYLATVEFHLKGGNKINQKLNVPYQDFQDVALLAIPESEYKGKSICQLNPLITSNIEIKNKEKIFDGNKNEDVLFPEGITPDSTVIINLAINDSLYARSIIFYPAHKPFKLNCELQVYKNNKYYTINNFEIDRSNYRTKQVGFIPSGPVSISFPTIKAKQFRLVFTGIKGNAGFSEINLTEVPFIERYIEKQLGQMCQDPQPLWDTYRWQPQPEPENKELVVNPTKETNITKYLTPDGTLLWDAPEGNWTLLRIGMVPTGVTNGPTTPEARGMEVDKMSKEDVSRHFDAFLGRIQNEISVEERKSLKYTIADSYETGSENWTDELEQIFKKRYGYDPLPWLPVLTGRIVSSADESNRFLWDLRRLVADLIAENYVGGLREVSNKHGLKLWLENYGHWGYPSEFLKYGGQSDEVSGEFWAEGDLGKIELKDASSAAHIYGKNQVWAESFTAGGLEYKRYPNLLKRKCDWSFTEGINSTLLHVYISQPYEDKMPGVNAWFGTEFNRLNTWFYKSKSFIDYVRRCNFMLQQGKPVVDIAYFIGEDTPLMTGMCDPEVPEGYSYDYINSEVIENRLNVKDGRLVLPDGMSYKVLVLPKLKSMRPELLRKISALIKEGAVVVGPPPETSPSLQNYPSADIDVKKLSSEIWGDIAGQKDKYRNYGKGMIISGMNLKDVMKMVNLVPDLNLHKVDSVLWVHRKVSNEDIYFLTNQGYEAKNINPFFRVKGKQPEIWDAVSSQIRKLPNFSQTDAGVSIPLEIGAGQSYFIVFEKSDIKQAPDVRVDNFPKMKELLRLNNSWEVSFDSTMRGPKEPIRFNKLSDWSQSADGRIRYYSGTAVYKTTFELAEIPEGDYIYIDLNNVFNLATVKLNGVNLGTCWTAPWRIDVTKSLKRGKNKLEIEIVNTWANRLIGDSKLPVAERKTWTISNPYKPDSPLQPSGMLGPVTLGSLSY